MNFKHAINAISTIAFRDFIKFIRDRRRLLATLIFPFVFVGVLGTSLESNLGSVLEFNFLTFTFTGVFAQVLFQSTASGIISLIEDRETDFAQELFIAPVSRYVIILGKIMGESMVSLAQGLAVVAFGIILGVEMSLAQILLLLPVAVIASLFGGGFGVLMLGWLDDQRTANQIFPFVLFPQIFLAGVFSPIQQLPPLLLILSRLMPLTYVVDLGRHFFYFDSPERDLVTINSPFVNLTVKVVFFAIFLGIGTWLFVRNSKGK